MALKIFNSSGGDDYGLMPVEIAKYAGIALGVLVASSVIFVWFFCRIEVGPGEFAPLLAKTGDNISNSNVLAPGPEFKGPQIEILREGRHFRNPWRWWWPKPMKATIIAKGQVGIGIRRRGTPLDKGQIVVDNDKQKGILEKQFNPGRYYLNHWEYDIEKYPMVKIEPGYMGIVTRLVGEESTDRNVFVVKQGQRGTQPELLGPGTYPQYSNPFVFMVTSIDVRSQKFEMGKEFAVTFPSKYGFDISVEGTIEWAPDLKKLPELFVKYVDEDDLKDSGGINNIQRKIILPYARSFFRMIGGNYRAVDYITGDTRITVQKEVERGLRESCTKQGIEIRSFVIHKTKPPEKILDQYRRRETALRDIDRDTKKIETQIGSVIMQGGKPLIDADGNAILDERNNPKFIGQTEKIGSDGKPVREGGKLAQLLQERQKNREEKLGGARVIIAELVRDAERYEKVEVTKAERDFAVAKINLEAARDTAAQALAKGNAKAEVTVMKHTAEAQGVKAKVLAFKTGEKYAEYQLITKFAPGIERILSNTDGLFARLFERFAQLEKISKTAKKDGK